MVGAGEGGLDQDESLGDLVAVPPLGGEGESWRKGTLVARATTVWEARF